MREKNIFYIYGCFSVSRYMKEGRKSHRIWIELNLKSKIEFLDTHVCINNPHGQRSGIIILLSKCYMVISDKLVGSFLDVLFFLLPVILSELYDKLRRKDIVTSKWSLQRYIILQWVAFYMMISWVKISCNLILAGLHI